MKAKKANKVYLIDEGQKKFYQEAGYDIVGDDGEVIAYGRGKTVPYDDYAAAANENKKLKEENAVLLKRIEELEAEQTVRTDAIAEKVQQEGKTTKKAGSKKAGE